MIHFVRQYSRVRLNSLSNARVFKKNHSKASMSNSFFRQHYWTSLQSVIPSATTAALTSIATNRFPIEHGAFGWTNYFPNKKR